MNMRLERQRSSFFNPLSYGNASLRAGRADRMSPDVKDRLLRELFTKEPCPYSHHIFKLAAIVYGSLRRRDTEAAGDKAGAQDSLLGGVSEAPAIEFASENEKRLTFTLVFQTLKYQRFLEDMLEDCVFYKQYPEFREEDSLVMIILSDYQYRKFQKRLPNKDEPIDPFLEHIEDSLRRCKTKLNAALARSRIKARVLTIDHLLPEAVRQNDRIGSNMHVYSWYNQLKTNLDDLTMALRDEGFRQVQSESRLAGRTYLRDQQCYDMLLFAHDQREFLETNHLVEEGHLVIQDKSSCVGAHSVRALINEGDDILHINVGSGLTTAHLASLTHDSETTVFSFGVHTEKQVGQVNYNLEKLGAKNTVQVFSEDFLDIDLQDERMKHLKVILMMAECTKSGVANPVNFIVTEGEDMTILRDLSLGHTDEQKLGELVVRHNSTLKHALRFPRTQAVVYCTRSAFEAENENVVTRAIEYVNMVQQKVKTPFRIAPPVLPLSDQDIESENPLCGKYLRYKPCSVMSGCFVATITREADDPKEAAKDILARAAARGIIKGVPVQEIKGKGSKSGRKKDKDKTKGGRQKRGGKKGAEKRSLLDEIEADLFGGKSKKNQIKLDGLEIPE